MSDFEKNYRHPLWQKRRLERFDAEGFKCINCGGTEKQLHIHHTYYEKDKKPWEYPDEALRVLCEDCHEEAESRKKDLKEVLRLIPDYEIEAMIGYGLGIFSRSNETVKFEVKGAEVLDGLSDYWGLNSNLIISKIIEGKIRGIDLYKLVEKYGSSKEFFVHEAKYILRELSDQQGD